MLLSGDSESFYIKNTPCSPYLSLASNQEEVDMKVTLNSMDVLNNMELKVVLQSPSGDTGMMALAVALIDSRNRLFFY